MNGQILGDRYQIRQQLGKKAGRRSLLACNLETEELVVIKLLSFSNDFEWDDLKLFEREAETLKSLSHPCIPRYVDYFEVNSPSIKGFALVQSYIPAQTLEQYLKAGRSFTEAEVKEIASLLLEILIYLHSLHPRVIHRDIKPSNILLGARAGNSAGIVYLVDFGSVQTVAKESGTRTVVGTYGYMPPEQFGDRTTNASDLYSLGATLISLVTGIHPADLPQKDFRISFEHIANLSPAFTDWLRWMIEPSLEKRLSSAVEALAALNDSQPRINTLALNKPNGSKIQLTKDRDSLLILIPPVGFQSSMVFTGLFAIAWNSFIFFWTINALAAPIPINVIFSLFSLPFWGAGFHLASLLLFPLFKSTGLRLTKQQIAFTTKIFGFKFYQRPSLTQDITKLVYTSSHFTKDLEENRFQVPAQLDIWAGVQKYEIGINNGIVKSEVELEWLAHELSDWLHIPITRES
ncbi:serine/threonine protein kinase [Scytonema hofmannii FACHB-248]|uniref:Serine/threonine protein kinase n=1 Tax=Scytonema hofmannii FACHB-248 TaxID=1842502 RepID=A0ABR8GN16_9CYAN|nr:MULTISPECIES: serine/threonine-protein kinase [Nostocales]MBD2604589.1 serine/threonine protein kinase [Scytonema hofmannii FACHB-248]